MLDPVNTETEVPDTCPRRASWRKEAVASFKGMRVATVKSSCKRTTVLPDMVRDVLEGPTPSVERGTEVLEEERERGP